jgi:hypothetical protein
MPHSPPGQSYEKTERITFVKYRSIFFCDVVYTSAHYLFLGYIGHLYLVSSTPHRRTDESL